MTDDLYDYNDPDINDNQFGAIQTFDVKNYVPWGWLEEVCACPVPTYVQLSIEDRKVSADYKNTFGRTPSYEENHCHTCGKRYRWQFMTCTQCAEFYDWQFYHHAIKGSIWRPEIPRGWAWARRICWNCIVKQDPAVEGDRPPEFLSAPRGNPQIAWDFNISFD